MLAVAGCVVALSGMHARAQTLTTDDINTIIGQAIKAAAKYRDKPVIAISDREGFILAVYNDSGVDPATLAGLVRTSNAISKAGTAAYLSSNAEAFTSRTAGYIIQPHFPPNVRNNAPGPLTGVGLSSLPFSDVNHFRPATNPSASIPDTSLSGNPGGAPLYKDGVLVGGIGIDGVSFLDALIYVSGNSTDEDVAMAAQNGYVPPSGITATNVLINGFRLAYANITSNNLGGVVPNLAPGAGDVAPYIGFLAAYPPTNSTGLPYNVTTPSPFPDIPAGSVRNQIISSSGGLINGQPRLTAGEVSTILHQAAARSQETRGAIRNPVGPAEVFIVVVDYYNLDGTTPTTTPFDASSPPTVVPQVLGSFRTPDATLFSYDVAAQKARTALFFSNNNMALSSRTVGFLAQGTYPPGIDGTTYGPYGPPTYGPSNKNFSLAHEKDPPFLKGPYGLQVLFTFNPNVLNPDNNPQNPPSPADPFPISATYAPNLFVPNGITVFPGGFPLYRNGQLIGAVGVSGDGVDQDDIISASGTVGFEAPSSIRADQFTFRGARLPYAKFPQNSSL
jgi:uncharacterized protein GlcG (DUF336 family)